MKTLSTVTVIFSILIISFACRDKNNPILSNETEDLLPLKVGNKWTYEYTFYSGIGAQPQYGTTSIEVYRDTTIKNDLWFITNFGIFRNTPEGVNQWDSERSKCIYPYPAKVNDSVDTDNLTQTKLISLNDTITVPNGKFTSVHYIVRVKAINDYVFKNHYLVKGIGLISFENANYNSTVNQWYISVRYQLKEYQLK